MRVDLKSANSPRSTVRHSCKDCKAPGHHSFGTAVGPKGAGNSTCRLGKLVELKFVIHPQHVGVKISASIFTSKVRDIIVSILKVGMHLPQLSCI